jgi:hypothetical protein
LLYKYLYYFDAKKLEMIMWNKILKWIGIEDVDVIVTPKNIEERANDLYKNIYGNGGMTIHKPLYENKDAKMVAFTGGKYGIRKMKSGCLQSAQNLRCDIPMYYSLISLSSPIRKDCMWYTLGNGNFANCLGTHEEILKLFNTYFPCEV